MASLDEMRKRQMLQALSNAGSQISLSQETFDQDMADANALRDRALALRQRASNLPPPAMIAPRQDFLTPSGKGGVMDFVKGILSSRLQAKGLRRDPLDIARQNLIAQDRFKSEIAGMNAQAQALQDAAQQGAARAVLQANRSGIPVSSVLGMPVSEQIQNLATRTGENETRQQSLDFQGDVEARQRFESQRALIPGLVASGALPPGATAQYLESLGPEELTEYLSSFKVQLPPGRGLPGDAFNPVTGEVELSDAYTPIQRSQIRMFGRELTAPETTANQKYGEIHEDYRVKGRFVDAKNISDLEKVLNYLIEADDKGFKFFTGPIAGKIPDAARAFYDEGRKSLDTRAALREVVQKTFREILGGQFAFLEGERLIQNAYDENLPAAYNLVRVRRLLFQAKQMAEQGALRAAHFDKYGTLYGVGEKQLDSNLDGLIVDLSDEAIADKGLFGLFSDDEREEMYNVLFNSLDANRDGNLSDDELENNDNSEAVMQEMDKIQQWEQENL